MHLFSRLHVKPVRVYVRSQSKVRGKKPGEGGGNSSGSWRNVRKSNTGPWHNVNHPVPTNVKYFWSIIGTWKCLKLLAVGTCPQKKWVPLEQEPSADGQTNHLKLDLLLELEDPLAGRHLCLPLFWNPLHPNLNCVQQSLLVFTMLNRNYTN